MRAHGTFRNCEALVSFLPRSCTVWCHSAPCDTSRRWCRGACDGSEEVSGSLTQKLSRVLRVLQIDWEGGYSTICLQVADGFVSRSCPSKSILVFKSAMATSLPFNVWQAGMHDTLPPTDVGCESQNHWPRLQAVLN